MGLRSELSQFAFPPPSKRWSKNASSSISRPSRWFGGSFCGIEGFGDRRQRVLFDLERLLFQKERVLSPKEGLQCRKERVLSPTEDIQCRRERLLSPMEGLQCRTERVLSLIEGLQCRRGRVLSPMEGFQCRKECLLSGKAGLRRGKNGPGPAGMLQELCPDAPVLN